MATNRRSSTRQTRGSGFVKRVTELPKDLNRLSDEVVDTFQEVAGRLNGRLTEGQGDNLSPTGNFEGVWWVNTTPGVADTDFTIVHNLGYTPKSYEIRYADKAAIIYTSPTAGAGPDSRTITLRCNVASAFLRIKVS